MEMPGSGKPGKPKAGFPSFPQPLEISHTTRDSHISTASTISQWAPKPGEKTGGGRFNAGHGKVEIQKQDSHFPQPAVLPAAQGRNQFKKRSSESRKDAPAALSRPPLSGSSCIGNELRFQDHSSIGKCYRPNWCRVT